MHNYVANNFNNIMALQMRNEAIEHDERGNRIFYNRQDAFELSDRQFIKIFRLNKEVTANLIDVAERYIPGQSRASSLDVSTKVSIIFIFNKIIKILFGYILLPQVLTALKFYGGGSYQSDVGNNIHLAIRQPSVSKCLHQVTDFLNHQDIINEWIKFPRNINELNTLKQRYANNHI